MKTSPDHGRRSLRYRQDTTFERDSLRTMLTLRDVWISQWEARRSEMRWV